MKNLYLTVLLFSIFFQVFNQASSAYYPQNNGSCDYNQLQYYQAQYDKALNDYQATLNSDPRLQNRGYQLPNPDGYISALKAQELRGVKPLASPEEIANIKYRTQIANQYGVPYDEYMNAQQQRIANQLEIQKQMMNNYQELINQCIKNMRY